MTLGRAPTERIGRLVDLDHALDDVIASTPRGSRTYALATYTAMLELHGVLSDRGLTAPFWEDER